VTYITHAAWRPARAGFSVCLGGWVGILHQCCVAVTVEITLGRGTVRQWLDWRVRVQGRQDGSVWPDGVVD
jgi:hypothetical protein